MFKTLIASTFLAASIAVPAMCAETGTTMNKNGAATTTQGAAGTNTEAGMPMYGQNVAASNIIGASVMDASNASIGKIDDLILSGQGQVTNYVVDVGGFLGIGSKRVSLTPSDVTITADANGNLQAKTQLTKDALNALPTYTKPEVPAAKSNNSGMTGTAPANGTGATGTTGAGGTTTAPAAKP
ncbi:PRC-barrel domain-containing protein [Rhizobium sp. C1]|uniref:PRC-barrel domain-containing protein n=1 Tax=Rhizobium sp. C1 TaxID=1349799 RepID=UPI001E5FD72D|nr:PRC-barrel domain-containing protein [Rhizobium sp. C1]MCD2177942.1 PRC-barrel domain-containing protein [Rhizobium sp. C1]